MSSLPLSNRRLALLSGFALLAVVGAASVCNAESPWRRHGTSPKAPPPYRVSLEGLDGSRLPTFQQAGSTYVLGDEGERYNVRVENPTGERVEAVVTVDGRDAISGEVGDYVAQRGYLIEPWGSVVIEGFRRSLDEVAAFRFSSKGDSYSARMGTPQNVGVIGVAFFPERARPPQPITARPRPRPRPVRPDDESGDRHARDFESSGEPAKRKPSAEAPASAAVEGSDRSGGRDYYRGNTNRLGTEFGESRESVVSSVAFVRASSTHPALVSSVRYDDAEGLSARGIDVSEYVYRRPDAEEPQAFPVSRFAQPPP